MKKQIIIYICVLISLLSCGRLLDDIALKSSVKRTIEEIESSYKGIVIDKYSPKEGIQPFWIKVKTEKNIVEFTNSSVAKYVFVGDSIVKNQNQNQVRVIKSNGEEKNFYYTLISKQVREHEDFPENWRNKWPDTTTN